MKNKILILAFAAALSANFALAENFEITADDISWATKSCDKGDMKSCGALAQIYNYGWGRAARSAKGYAVIRQSLQRRRCGVVRKFRHFVSKRRGDAAR